MLLVKKDYHLRPKLNQIVRHAFEGGLLVNRNKKKRQLSSEENHAIKIGFFSAAFVFIMICGSMLATASFCAEYFINKKLLQQPQSSIWKVLGRFFDAKRYYLTEKTNIKTDRKP